MVNKCSHTVDDFLNVKRTSDVEISKDGSKVAFMVSGTFKNFKEEFVSEIMTQSIKDGKERGPIFLTENVVSVAIEQPSMIFINLETSSL